MRHRIDTGLAGVVAAAALANAALGIVAAGADGLPGQAIVDGRRLQPRPAPDESRAPPSVPGLKSLLDENAGDDRQPTVPRDLYGKPFPGAGDAAKQAPDPHG